MKTPVFLLLVLIAANAFGAPPTAVASKAQYVRKLFAEATSSAYRVHLMVLPSDVFVDPPPRAEEFELAAKVVLTIESGAAFDLIHQVLNHIDKSSWMKESVLGYPGSYWQLRGPSGVVLDFLVDEVGRMVCHEGVWYGVDAKLLKILTQDTVRLGSELLAKRRTPDWKP